MKPLIIYFSRSANNEKLAMQLQQHLNCPVKVILETNRKRSNFSLFFNILLGLDTPIVTPDIPFQDYDWFILVAPIWAGRIAGPMQTFIRNNARYLKTISFATLCGGRPGQQEKIFRQLARLTGKDPAGILELQLTELFSAKNPPSHAKAAGYQVQPTDWAFFDEQISRFAADIDPKSIEKRAEPATAIFK